MADSVAAARQEVVDARRAVESELDEMGTATRQALDIPSKVKRQPVRYGALAGGAAFLALGGPKRVFKSVESRFFPRPRVRRLTPKEIDRTIDRLPEEDREQVRAHLERDFAAYLEKTHPQEQPTGRHAFWQTYEVLLGVLGAAGARALAKRLFERPTTQFGVRGARRRGEEGYTE